MVAMQIRSYDYMPSTRYILRLEPETEPLHAMLKRLRTERGWSQYDLAARVDPEMADNPQIMRNLQTQLSRYETGKTTRPDEVMLEKLEKIYGLPPNELFLAAGSTALRRKRPETLFPIESRDVAAVRQLSEWLKQSGETEGSPSFEERIINYARYLAERRGSDE